MLEWIRLARCLGLMMREGSLLGRLLPPLSAAVVLITLLVLLVGVTAIRTAVLSSARTRAHGLLAAQRHTLERWMRTAEHESLQGLALDLARNPDVEAVRLLNPDHQVSASSIPSDVGQNAGVHGLQRDPDGDLLPPALSGNVRRQPALHRVEPLLNKPACMRCHSEDGLILGFLDLDVAVATHSVGLMTFGTLGVLMALLYVGAVVGVATPLLRRIVGRPVRELNDGMRRVEAGDLDVRVSPSGTKEVDDVISGFNVMVERLRRGRAAEEEARRLQLERVEHLAAVGELATGLAHEIRNPLSGVKAVVDFMAQEAGGDDASRRAVLHDASSELSRINEIISELLQYARPKLPKLVVLDLNELVRSAVSLTATPAVAAGADVRFALDPELPPVLGDTALLRQVLVNLVINALQAAIAPNVATVEVATGVADGFVWCRVRDNGTGVPAARAEAIFKPFVTTKTRGTGLGLAVSRRIVELHGGRLALDNPGESGASFSFTVPTASTPGASG